VGGGWIKLHNEELHNLYASPTVIRVIKSRTVRWAMQQACVVEMRDVHKILVGKPEGRDQSEDVV
jgi:hypothetical protein